jgi:hypothetical protein
MAFMRAYGMMAGDPRGGGKLAPRRKGAASGPRAKADRKKHVRNQRATRGAHQGPGGKPKKKNKGPGFDFGALLGKGADIAQQFIPGGGIASKLGLNISDLGKLLPHEAAAAAAAAGASPTEVAAVAHAAHKGGKHRRKNPANVKALRHALGRVEGFGRLVKRVNHMLPTAHRFAVHPVMKHKRKRRSA